MDPTRYQAIKELFLQVMERPADDRTRLLDDLCEHDSELQREVERLVGQTTLWPTEALQEVVGADVRGAVEQTAALPRALGPYQLERELGRGGMGIVYVAHDPRLDRRVALKTLQVGLLGASRSRELLQREARALATLSHPYIATVHSLEELEDTLCVTMELVPGETLADRLARGALPVDEALRLVRQLAQALEVAHDGGVIHLDLKPGNVIVTPEQHIKVLDFGLARTLGSDAGERGFIGGTPGYMSPEQMLGQPLDPRADLFSLGAILFECLAGAPALPGAESSTLVRRTLEADIAWEALPDGLPAHVRELLQALLAYAPDDRPGSAAEVTRTLGSGLAERQAPRAFATATAATHLPRPRGRLCGRRDELARLQALLHRPGLVTVTGMGGVGKTRLALEAARGVAAENGAPAIVWVDLAGARAVDSVDQTVAAALGVRAATDDLREAILERLSGDRTVLVCDSAEHLLEALHPLVEAMLGHCPQLTVLVTSREQVGLGGEEVLALSPFAASELDNAVEMFVERARQAGCDLGDEDLPVVQDVVRRLEGIPLALELAAGRLRLMSLPELRERLDDRLRVLGGGGRKTPERHRTLQATLDWSHDLLAPRERTLFRRLAIFASGWTLRGAEQVCAGDDIEPWDVLDLLGGLVDRSLVFVEELEGNDRRYRMLETIRAYAHAHLTDDERKPLLDGLLDFSLALAEEAEPHLTSSDQVRWLRRLDAEHANVRAAVEHGLASGDRVTALRVAAHVWSYWDVRGHLRRGRQLLGELLEGQRGEIEWKLEAKARTGLSILARQLGEMDFARTEQERCITLCRRYGAERLLATSLMNLAVLLRGTGDFEGARANHTEAIAIFERVGEKTRLSYALLNLAIVENHQGYPERSVPLLERALGIAMEQGDVHTQAACYSNLGTIHLNAERNDDARRHLERSLALHREVGDRVAVARGLGNLAILEMERGDDPRAEELLRESLSTRRELDDLHGIAVAQVNLAPLFTRQDRLDEAGEALAECIDALRRTGERRVSAYALEAAARLAVARGGWAKAAELLGAAAALREAHHLPLPPSEQQKLDELATRVNDQLGDDLHFAAGRAHDWSAALDLAAKTTRA